MSRLQRPLRALLLAALLSTNASAVSLPNLLERQSTCSANEISCPAGLPSDFCCPSGSTCLALAGNTTALCCPPTPGSCQSIQPIPCDLTLQDVANHHDSVVKTTVLNGTLPTCGTNTCCPFGYSCDNHGNCVIDQNQTTAPAGAPQPSASPSSSRSGASTQAPSADPAQSSSANGSSSVFPTTGVIIGVIVGALGAATLFGLLVFLCWRRRKVTEKLSHHRGSSTSSFGNVQISKPIPLADDPTSGRTEFNLKAMSSTNSTPTRSNLIPVRDSRLSRTFGASEMSRPSSRGTTPESGRSRPLRPGGYGNYPVRPQTPRLQREPSTEDIQVYAAPGTVDRGSYGTRNTEWGGLMKEAGLSDPTNGGRYVPDSPHTTAVQR